MRPLAATPRSWWQTIPPLTLGIGVSVVLHAAVLSLHFTFPDASRFVRDSALDIILVNARTAHKPVNAQARAQANLDGGGDTDEDRRAKTPLPPSLQQSAGDDLETLKRRANEMEAQQQKLVALAKRQRSTFVGQTGQAQNEPQPASGQDLAEAARAMARLEGEISKSVEEYNKRPRKKSVGVRAEEYRFARYIEDWRAKVERLGTLNYPEAARGKMYGSLVLTVAITADGVVKGVEINRSSGQKILDDAARRIVLMGSPYASFPPEIRRDTDILEITRTWSFTQGDTVQAK
ncbi:MAG: TonB family protein [Betaproteobacteria bacterium]